MTAQYLWFTTQKLSGFDQLLLHSFCSEMLDLCLLFHSQPPNGLVHFTCKYEVTNTQTWKPGYFCVSRLAHSLYMTAILNMHCKSKHKLNLHQVQESSEALSISPPLRTLKFYIHKVTSNTVDLSHSSHVMWQKIPWYLGHSCRTLQQLLRKPKHPASLYTHINLVNKPNQITHSQYTYHYLHLQLWHYSLSFTSNSHHEINILLKHTLHA